MASSATLHNGAAEFSLVFDCGSSTDLEHVGRILGQGAFTRLQLQTGNAVFGFAEPPFGVDFPCEPFEVAGIQTDRIFSCKIYPTGEILVAITFPLGDERELSEVEELRRTLANHSADKTKGLILAASACVQNLVERIRLAITSCEVVSRPEDYLIITAENVKSDSGQFDPQDRDAKLNVANMLRRRNSNHSLSEETVQDVFRCFTTEHAACFTVVDADAAFIIGEHNDNLAVIELLHYVQMALLEYRTLVRKLGDMLEQATLTFEKLLVKVAIVSKRSAVFKFPMKVLEAIKWSLQFVGLMKPDEGELDKFLAELGVLLSSSLNSFDSISSDINLADAPHLEATYDMAAERFNFETFSSRIEKLIEGLSGLQEKLSHRQSHAVEVGVFWLIVIEVVRALFGH